MGILHHGEAKRNWFGHTGGVLDPMYDVEEEEKRR